MNAAVWLGTAIFFTFGVEPGCFSADMHAALGVGKESYFSGAIASALMIRYYHTALVCGIIALFHLFAEWIYKGRPAPKSSFLLVGGLFLLMLIGSNAIQPALTRLNKKHYTAAAPADRVSAGRYFRVLSVTGDFFNLLTISGLVIYVWRVSTPSDTLRFVRPVQFRS